MTVTIVGASVAGIRTAQALRGGGYGDRIVVLGDEPHVPYDRPPLSKEMLDANRAPDPVPLVPGDQLAELDLDLRLGVSVTGLDVAARTLITELGPVEFDRLVIATGARPVMLAGTENVAGIHALRTLDDALNLRSELSHASQVVVVGGGFIGAEFTAAAVARGVSVTIVELQDVPLAHVLGPRVGGELAEVHRRHGVRIITGVGVAHVEGDGRVTGVVLTDGSTLPADLVVVGIGVRPATEWLVGSDLPLDDGVVCDEAMRVVGQSEIYAAGDVARWPHPMHEVSVRIEHWTSAGEHAAVVASSILGHPLPRWQVPYVWTDLYGRRIQIVGRPSAGVATLHGEHPERLVALYADEEGVLVGALVMDDPRALMSCRQAISRRTRLDEFQLGGLARLSH